PLKDMSEGLSLEFRQHFMGTHFFNPVRYMHLLELIPGADTLPEVLDFVAAFGEKRDIMIEVVKNVAKTIFIPFSVGGGIRTLEDMRAVLLAGAEKVSVNSAAVKNPEIISQGAKAFGNQCIVLGMDVKHVGEKEGIASGYEVVINGGRTYMGIDALEWAKKGQALGAGEICLNSIDADGTKDGYEMVLTRLISDNVSIPVIASGGAGKPEHISEVLTKGRADAALIASMVHYGTYTITDIKNHLEQQGIKIRRSKQFSS
ncbi:MAG: imidazole glycerol phosphate synthase subunit HisF, partial [Desulfamplus sp.]|nr:imidazole glycerol phosphate synthase subunit HisF [Desulfamplus sp.]